MFSLRSFILEGLLRAVGEMADYQVILNAVGWHTKAILTEEDLRLVADKIAKKDEAYAEQKAASDHAETEACDTGIASTEEGDTVVC